MEAHLLEWLNLSVRWVHMITGVAWIGASFYFVWLENNLNRVNPKTGLAGDLWAIHGGGIYHLEKYKLAPPAMPENLHWFKWEAYFTWMSGIALLCVVFYSNPTLYLLAPGSTLSGPEGVAIGIGIITLLISLGFGVQGMVIREVTKNNPSDIIDISNKSLESFALLDTPTIERIRKIEGIDQVEIRASIGGKFFNGDAQTDVVINAISRHYLDLARSDLDAEVRERMFLEPRSILITPKLAVFFLHRRYSRLRNRDFGLYK